MEQAAVREAIERTAGALQTAVGGIDGKLEQAGQALSGLKAEIESSQSMVQRLEQDIQQRLERQAAAIKGLAARQTTMRWIGIAAAVFSGVAMVGMVTLLMR